MSGILDQHRRWMREQGWEVAIIQVDRVSKTIVAVGYRYWVGMSLEGRAGSTRCGWIFDVGMPSPW